MEKKAGSSGSTEISKTSRTRVTRKSARACQDTCADLPLRKQPAYTLSRQITPFGKAAYKQIGNAVPCNFAFALACAVKETFSTDALASPPPDDARCFIGVSTGVSW